MRLAGPITAALLCFFTTPAFATGGFTCEVDDASLKFSAGGVFPGAGPGFLNFGAKAEIHLPGVPEKLRNLDLSQSLVHSWIYTGDLRLRLKAENDEDNIFKSLDLVIQTAGEADGGDWEGTYILDIFDSASPDAPVNAKGKAMCSVG
jgi:hypothetical protein